MKKFRVISDLHIDYNDRYPIAIDDDIFTIICGDTSGDPSITIDWVKSNIKSGILISGNHLPYNKHNKTIQELRTELAEAFPIDADITYLDVECGVWKKEVDGIVFIGTCMYSNMKIPSAYNPKGIQEINYHISKRWMNDFRYGIKNRGNTIKQNQTIHPSDYSEWFENAFTLIDTFLTENEKLAEPKPVVLITHYPLIKTLLLNNNYVDCDNITSYGSDFQDWIKKHFSIKCYCCGHAHAVHKKYRNYRIKQLNNNYCLVVSNTRGYVSYCHDVDFNINTFVNTAKWTISKSRKQQKIKGLL